MRKYMTWEKAIEHVLAKEGGALHYTKIAARVLKMRLRPETPTPVRTVLGVISRSLTISDDSPFERVGSGLYRLRTRHNRRKGDIKNAAGEARASV
jgi:hypothetical protein